LTSQNPLSNLLKRLDGIIEALDQLRADLQALAKQGPEGVTSTPPLRESPQAALERVKARLPQTAPIVFQLDLDGRRVVVVPVKWLGTELWREINDKVTGMGGWWAVKDGKGRWLVPFHDGPIY